MSRMCSCWALRGSERGCRIRSFTVVEDCTLGNGVLLRQSCILAESTVADGAKIGPFAHLRPGSEIGEKAHIGNFVETKKAKVGKGAKASHLTYLGDAEVGEGANIGAGVITCNYDGVNKHKTLIGKGAFVGSDSTLVAPVTVGDGAYIGAGSCITKPVPAGALAVGRAHQVTKEGWAEARRARARGRKNQRTGWGQRSTTHEINHLISFEMTVEKPDLDSGYDEAKGNARPLPVYQG